MIVCDEVQLDSGEIQFDGHDSTLFHHHRHYVASGHNVRQECLIEISQVYIF